MSTDRLPLRDYQRECIDAIKARIAEYGDRRIAAVLPTGAGKTVVFGTYAAEYKDAHPNRRVLVLAHTDELVQQAASKFRSIDHSEQYSVGIVKAGADEWGRDIVIASVQTLRSRRRQRPLLDDAVMPVGLIIVDECHHVTASTYMSVLNAFGAFDERACVECSGRGYLITEENPAFGEDCTACGGSGKLSIDSDVVTLGFTATLARSDGASLGKVWQSVAYRKGIDFMINAGYLKSVRGKRIEVPDLDLSRVKKVAGDYSEGQLGEALTASLAPEIVAKAYEEHASDRSGILFAPTVESSRVMAEALRAGGVSADVVHGGLPRDERREIIARFERGDVQVLANCMVLTEGFDSPRASCAVIARPTKSTPLYQQMVGRVLRPFAGVPEALILDVTGVSAQHDLASLVSLIGEDSAEKREGLQAGDVQEESNEVDDGSYLHRGPIVARDFDPLVKASAWQWGMTSGGTMFLGAGAEAYVFLVPTDSGTFDVCWCSKDRYKRTGGYTRHRDIEGGYALAWAENEAFERGGHDTGAYLSRKGASWRKKKPTDKQVDYARRLGIVVLESDKSGDVGNKIDHVLASQRIDPIVRALTGG